MTFNVLAWRSLAPQGSLAPQAFITTPGMGPTNNLAEQAVRFVVIDRRITQGTRSEKGRETCERLWTVVGTCALQGRSAFEFIYASVASPR